MNLGMHNKVYIVTSGAGGIGEAVCKLIASEGGIVVIADKNREQSDALANEIINQKQRAFAIAAEFANEENCRHLIDDVVGKYNRIDGLVNVGTNDTIGLKSGSVAAFEQLLRFNLLHYFIITHYAFPHLIKTKGSIVNIGSQVKVTGLEKTSGYAASMGGVSALTREWAVDLLPYQLRVNAVLAREGNQPEDADRIKDQLNDEQTSQHATSPVPSGNYFTMLEEIANAVVFLLSEQSSHTTGQIIFC